MNSAPRPLRLAAAIALLLLLHIPARSQGSAPQGSAPQGSAPQGIGIVDGVPIAADQSDTAASSWLPRLPDLPAGAHGFLHGDGRGGFLFADGAPARFFGVTLQWGATLPDSAEAIRLAARLAKLGVNLVRLEYFDNSYDWGASTSILDPATGFRSLEPTRTRRLDWLIHQLERRGIYIYLPLRSARAPRREDGLGVAADSAYWLGAGAPQIYPEVREAQKLVARLLLDHVNPFSGRAWRADPGIAFLEISDKASLPFLWSQGVVDYRPGVYGFSWRDARRLDTLWAAFLAGRYGTTAALRDAWGATILSGGFPNLIREGSFEGAFETEWQITAYGGITSSVILDRGGGAPDGTSSLGVRLRGTSGNVYAAYMVQPVTLAFGHTYHLSFKAKTSDTQGTLLRLVGVQAGDGGLFAGLFSDVTLGADWKGYDATFTMPVDGSAPANIYFFFGQRDATVSFDAVELREVAAPGLGAAEKLEDVSVARLPWNALSTTLVAPRRAKDMAAFYMELDRDYMTGFRSFVKDSVGAGQPVTGAGLYWVGTPLEWQVEREMDFSIAATVGDWVAQGNGDWKLLNSSPLRSTGGGPIVDLARQAHASQPMLAAYIHPAPGRYQAESMLYLPAYASLQGIDGVIWDVWADKSGGPSAVDSTSYNELSRNPMMSLLLPVASRIFRDGAVRQAAGTILLRRSLDRTLDYPRLGGLWGTFGIPGGLDGRVAAISRIAIDSVDARYPTQADDLSLPQLTEGELWSDTHELHWEYGRGTLTVNAPTLQGASGNLTRAGGIATDLLDIDLFSGNETATILWTAIDSARRLDRPGRSLLVVASRTEREGLGWVDSATVRGWGTGGMILDRVRARLTFTLPSAAAELTVTPLDASGQPAGAPLPVQHEGTSYVVTIDQKSTPSMLFGVEIGGDRSSAPVAADAPAGVMLTMTGDPGLVAATLPGARRSVVAELIDPLGRVAARLHDGPMEAGRTMLRTGLDGVASGLYFVRVTTELGERAVLKLPVVR